MTTAENVTPNLEKTEKEEKTDKEDIKDKDEIKDEIKDKGKAKEKQGKQTFSINDETKEEVKPKVEDKTEIHINNGTEKKEEAPKVEPVEVEPGLAGRIVKQLEYYFGDKNLPNDRFMLREIALDNGWISFNTMLNFKRLSNICSDKEKLSSAVAKSGSDLLSVSEDLTKIRRRPERPLPTINDEYKTTANAKTVYVKGLPLDISMDKAEEFFLKFGETCYVKLRKDAEHKFKGSVFVEYKEQTAADKLIALDDLKFSEADEAPLTILSRNNYFLSKNKKTRVANNKKRAEQLEPVEPVNVEFEKGRVLKILTGDVQTDREAMKDLFSECSVAWVNYNRGDSVAFIRFSDSAQTALDSVKKEGKFVLSEKEMEVEVITGEDEETYWKKCAEEKAEFYRKNKKRKIENNRGRYRGGRGNKRQRS